MSWVRVPGGPPNKGRHVSGVFYLVRNRDEMKNGQKAPAKLFAAYRERVPGGPQIPFLAEGYFLLAYGVPDIITTCMQKP